MLNLINLLGGRFFTCDNLIERGFYLAGWCYMCQCSGETVDHLLIPSDIAYALWIQYLEHLGFNGCYQEGQLISCSLGGISSGSTYQIFVTFPVMFDVAMVEGLRQSYFLRFRIIKGLVGIIANLNSCLIGLERRVLHVVTPFYKLIN